MKESEKIYQIQQLGTIDGKYIYSAICLNDELANKNSKINKLKERFPNFIEIKS